MRLFKRKPIPRPKLEVEFGSPIVGPKTRVLLNGTDISRWVMGLEVEAGSVGDRLGVVIHVLPDELRVKAPITKFVTTGEDGVTRAVKL